MSFTFGIPGESQSKTVNPYKNGFLGNNWYLRGTDTYKRIDYGNNAGIVWQRDDTNGLQKEGCLCVDSEGNAYGLSGTQTVVKYSPEGNIVWELDISSNLVWSGTPSAFCMDKNQNICILTADEIAVVTQGGSLLGVFSHSSTGDAWDTTDSYVTGFQFVSGLDYFVWNDGKARVRRQQHLVENESLLDSGGGGNWNGLTVDENGYIYIATQGGDLRIIDINGNHVRTYTGLDGGKALLQVSINRDYIVTSNDTSEIVVWDRQLNKVNTITHNTFAYMLHISRDNRIYAGNDGGFNSRVYDIDGNNLQNNETEVSVLAFPYRYYSTFNP